MMEKIVKCLFFVLSLFVINPMYAEKYKSAIYVKYVHEIVSTFAKEMKKELGLICIGSGGGMPYDVEMINVKFLIYKQTTIEQARELLVKANQRLIEIINAHEKIRPFLREYPFTSKRADVSISFKKKNNRYYIDGSIAYAFHVYNRAKDNNIICYCEFDPKKKDLVDVCVEQYEDALKIVTGNKTFSLKKNP